MTVLPLKRRLVLPHGFYFDETDAMNRGLIRDGIHAAVPSVSAEAAPAVTSAASQ